MDNKKITPITRINKCQINKITPIILINRNLMIFIVNYQN